jgi:hypothetical protein
MDGANGQTSPPVLTAFISFDLFNIFLHWVGRDPAHRAVSWSCLQPKRERPGH